MNFQLKRHQKIIFSRYKIIYILICSLVFASCTECDPAPKETKKVQQSDPHADSVDVISLVKKMYQWYETKSSKGDFMAVDPVNGENVYAEIDRNELSKKLKEIEQSQLFTKEFADNYNKIALLIDKEIKEKKGEWLVGDLSPYTPDADAWCNCQDSPEQYWETMKIVVTQLNNTDAALMWSWPNKED